MAADFNAGSIEGTLDLDLSPFLAGLKKAQIEADKFERTHVAATADLDTGELLAKKTVANRELDALDRKKVTAKADIDIAPFLAKMAIVDTVLKKSLDFGGAGMRSTGPGLLAAKFVGIAGGLLSIAAAAGPAGAAMVGFGAASTAAMSGAEASLGLFAVAATSDFSKIQKAAQKGLQLNGPAGVAETALKRVEHAWDGLLRKTSGPVFGVMTDAFHAATSIIPKLVPLLNATAHGVDNIVNKVSAFAHTQFFAHFLTQLTGFMHGFLTGAGPVIVGLLHTLMAGFEALQPLMSMLGQGIEHVVKAAEHFTTGGGLRQFVHYVVTETPAVLNLLDSVVHGLEHLAKGIAPLAGPALHFITTLVQAIGGINLNPFTRGFGEVLQALEPLLKVGKTLINVVLGPLGHLLGNLAHGVITPLAHSLGQELHPAFHALSQILNALVKPLGQFLGSIANLVNPTGVHLLATLLQMLVGPIKILAPAIGHLAVAFESVIDQGINAITPLLPKLKPLLDQVAHAAASLANGMAAIISHKDVALALLAMIGAFKGLQLISGVVGSMKAFVGTLRTLMELQKAEGFMAAIAAIAPKIAAGMDLIGGAIDFMMGPWGLLILGISALVIGFIEAYKHSQTFRDIVNGALRAVEAVAKDVWGWMKVAWHDLGVAFRWAWDHYFKYVFDFYKIEANVLWDVLKIVWAGMKAAWQGLATAFMWTYQHVIVPVFNFFKAAGQDLWNFLKRVWTGLQIDWHALGTAFQWTWDHVLHPVFDVFKTAISDVKSAFGHAVDGIKAAWDRLKGVAEAPVRFVVGTVIDKGIIGSMNKVAGFFHLPSIPSVPVPFSTGGSVPGHAPTDTADNVTARLTPGEFVVKRKSALKIEQTHPGALEHMNATGHLPKYGFGGWIGDAWHSVTGAAKGAFDWTKNLLSNLNPMQFIKNHVESLLGDVGGGPFGQLAAGAAKHLLGGAVAWLKNKMGSFFSGGGGQAIGAIGSGVKRWAPDVLRALAMLGQPASLLPAVLQRMTQESGGNPTIVNKWDSNWAAGHPSVGLMQVIGGTFSSYAGPFRGTGPFEYGVSVNPLANIYAGLNYALHAYGSIAQAMLKPGGYAGGTMGATPGWHRVGERGPEMMYFRGGEHVVPAGASQPGETDRLLRQILAALRDRNVDPSFIDALGAALSKHSEATMRRMVQIARAT